MNNKNLKVAQYKNILWGVGYQLQRALRCELNAVYYLGEYWLNQYKYDMVERCVECLQVLEHPRAYTMSGLLYENIRKNIEEKKGDYKTQNEREYADKALEMFKIAYERQEKDIDFYYGIYLANYGNKDEAVRILEKISQDRNHKDQKVAKRYFNREKKRAGSLGKFSISAYTFWEKPLLHLFYLLIIGAMLIMFFPLGGILLACFIAAKFKVSRIVAPKNDFDFLRLQIGGDKIYETSVFTDFPPCDTDEEFLVSKTYNGYGIKVGESHDKKRWEAAFIDFISSVETETLEIREKKKEGFIQRAQLGDKRAIEALKYFYGLYYEDGNIVEGELLLGITQESLNDFANLCYETRA